MRRGREHTESVLKVRRVEKDLVRYDLSCSMIASRDWSGTMRREMEALAAEGMSVLDGPSTDTLWIERAG